LLLILGSILSYVLHCNENNYPIYCLNWGTIRLTFHSYRFCSRTFWHPLPRLCNVDGKWVKYEYGTLVEWSQVETEVFGKKIRASATLSTTNPTGWTWPARWPAGKNRATQVSDVTSVMCELSVTWKGRDISRWLPQQHYQPRGAKHYSGPISSPFVAATCNICVMTKPPVCLAPTAGEICTNPYRLQHMRYTDFMLYEVIFFCKKVFQVFSFLIQKENPSLHFRIMTPEL